MYEYIHNVNSYTHVNIFVQRFVPFPRIILVLVQICLECLKKKLVESCLPEWVKLCIKIE